MKRAGPEGGPAREVLKLGQDSAVLPKKPGIAVELTEFEAGLVKQALEHFIEVNLKDGNFTASYAALLGRVTDHLPDTVSHLELSSRNYIGAIR